MGRNGKGLHEPSLEQDVEAGNSRVAPLRTTGNTSTPELDPRLMTHSSLSRPFANFAGNPQESAREPREPREALQTPNPKRMGRPKWTPPQYPLGPGPVGGKSGRLFGSLAFFPGAPGGLDDEALFDGLGADPDIAHFAAGEKCLDPLEVGEEAPLGDGGHVRADAAFALRLAAAPDLAALARPGPG